VSFDKLIDLLLQFGKFLFPVRWVQPWEGGVRITSFLHWQWVSAVGPGLHFKIPLIQLIEVTDVATTTDNLPPQTLTTKDGRSVTAAGIVKYNVKDVRPLFTAVVNRMDVLRDVSLGAIARVVRERTWDEAQNSVGAMEKEVRDAIASEVNKFGFKVERFTFSDFGVVRTIRLLQELPFHQ